MAIRVVLSRLVSSIQSADSNNTREAKRERKTSVLDRTGGRRGLLISTVAAATQVSDSQTELLHKYLKKTEENKRKYEKERLDSYYKRNYKDYFGFVEGSLKQKNEPLTESEKGIIEWLKVNK